LVGSFQVKASLLGIDPYFRSVEDFQINLGSMLDRIGGQTSKDGKIFTKSDNSNGIEIKAKDSIMD